jgi:hypothetical protein
MCGVSVNGAWPIQFDALAAHLGEGLGAAVHPLHHVVTADAGRGAAAFRHFGRGVVRATGAVMRGAYGVVAAVRPGPFPWPRERPDAPGCCRWCRSARGAWRSPGRSSPGSVRRGSAAANARSSNSPTTTRALVQRPVVELPGELVFENAALFLDHQNLVQALGELMHRHRLQRPAHADLEYAQAHLGAQRFVQTEIIQRLAHVEVGLAGGDDAQARVRRIELDLVEVVGQSKGAGGVDFVQVLSRASWARGGSGQRIYTPSSGSSKSSGASHLHA